MSALGVDGAAPEFQGPGRHRVGILARNLQQAIEQIEIIAKEIVPQLRAYAATKKR